LEPAKGDPVFDDDPEFPGVIPPVIPIIPQFTPLLVPGCPATPAEKESTRQAAVAMEAMSSVFI
jgi:hypothetical protein